MMSITYLSRSLFLVAFLFTLNTATSENPEKAILFFEGSWQDAIELAKEEDKPIFLAVTASWCGPCKRLISNTFTNDDVADFYNRTFVNLVMDGELGEGITLAREYQVKAYPTLLYINPNGEIIRQEKGYHNPKSFLQLGQRIGATNLPSSL